MKLSFQRALPVLLVSTMVRDSHGQEDPFCARNELIGTLVGSGKEEFGCVGVPSGPLKIFWHATFCNADGFKIRVFSGGFLQYESEEQQCLPGSLGSNNGSGDVNGGNTGDWKIEFECFNGLLSGNDCDLAIGLDLVDCGCPAGQMETSPCTLRTANTIFPSGNSADASCVVPAPQPQPIPQPVPVPIPATPSPVQPPSCSGIDFGVSCIPCFSELTSVQLKNVDVPVPMKDIKIGDSVLTKSGSYKPVYAWGHLEPSRPAEFLQIHTQGKGAPLEITGKHMVFVEGQTGPVCADTVNVGDFLLDDAGKKNLKVVKISKVKRTGLYSPLTVDGTIVVNGGIVASNYIDPHSVPGDQYMKLGSVALPFEKATMYHIWFSPLRMMCMGVSAQICEYRNEDGISLWAALGLTLVKFADGHGSFFSQLVIYGLMIIVPAISMVIEYVAGPSLGPMLILLGGVLAFKWKKQLALADISVTKMKKV